MMGQDDQVRTPLDELDPTNLPGGIRLAPVVEGNETEGLLLNAILMLAVNQEAILAKQDDPYTPVVIYSPASILANLEALAAPEEPTICEYCEGRRTVEVENVTGQLADCPECGGSGKPRAEEPDPADA